MRDFAVIVDGLVDNVIVINGEPKKDFNYGGEVILLPEGVGRGWKYDGKNFTAPTESEKSPEQLVDEAEMNKQGLINTAQQSISLLQTKLLMGRTLTEAETVKVNAVLDYIDAVSAIDTQAAPNITWPEQPQ